jgi:hypothetical protein
VVRPVPGSQCSLVHRKKCFIYYDAHVLVGLYKASDVACMSRSNLVGQQIHICPLSIWTSLFYTMSLFWNAIEVSLRNITILIWVGTKVSWYRELTDLDQWDITVPHTVDQLGARETEVCWCIVREKCNMSEVIASINQRTLRRMAQNMVKRVDACIQENDGHFRHLLWTVFRFYFIVVLRSETSV